LVMRVKARQRLKSVHGLLTSPVHSLVGLPAEVVALLLPSRWQRTLQLLQHHPLIRPPRKDRLNNVRRQQRQPQEPAHVTLGDVLGIADLAHRRIDALVQQPLPPPRPRHMGATVQHLSRQAPRYQSATNFDQSIEDAANMLILVGALGLEPRTR
jgi:hypothetical protein